MRDGGRLFAERTVPSLLMLKLVEYNYGAILSIVLLVPFGRLEEVY
jgi:hypothetical protein